MLFHPPMQYGRLQRMTIYAAFDDDGRCLYVGETSREHPVLRWAEHVRNPEAAWTDDAVRWEVVRGISERSVFDRLEPLHGERRATVTKPTCAAGSNVAAVPSPRPGQRTVQQLKEFLDQVASEQEWSCEQYDLVWGVLDAFPARLADRDESNEPITLD